MTNFMDYMISPLPIRIVDLKVDRSKLGVKSLVITEIGHLPGRTLQRTGSTFESWAFAYIVGGRGQYRVNEGPWQAVEQGSLFFVWPGAEFQYGPEQGDYWDEYYVRFEGSRIAEWLSHWLTGTDKVARIGLNEQWVDKIEMLFLLMESGIPANIDRAALLLESLVYEFARHAGEERRGPQRTELIFSIVSDIGLHLSQPLEAGQLAKRHHIAVSTLRRMISEYTGYPLHEYVHRVKMAEAKKILLYTDRRIHEIAVELGYKDTFYFSRLFKKYTGLSPDAYRRTR